MPNIMDAQTELFAQQTVTMALAQTIVSMTMDLVHNTGDIGLLDAVIETLRDQVSAMSGPFIVPGQTLADGADKDGVMVLFRERAGVMTELIEKTCQSWMVGDPSPKR